MSRCPCCNSIWYHVTPGYGAYCEECGFEKDAKGRIIYDPERENNNH